MSGEHIIGSAKEDPTERNLRVDGDARMVILTQRRPLDIQTQEFQIPFATWKKIAAVIISGESDMEEQMLSTIGGPDAT